ncbi:MAG: hypothetical protein ACI9MJ_001072 [Alphaproteobacteria bacterium]|jgi:hypothetical protein
MAEQATELVSRRLSDRVISAFDLAFHQGNVDAAGKLYQVLEIVLSSQGGLNRPERREDVENIRNVGDRYLELKRQAQAA